jgi:hypothetical protein
LCKNAAQVGDEQRGEQENNATPQLGIKAEAHSNSRKAEKILYVRNRSTRLKGGQNKSDAENKGDAASLGTQRRVRASILAVVDGSAAPTGELPRG